MDLLVETIAHSNWQCHNPLSSLYHLSLLAYKKTSGKGSLVALDQVFGNSAAFEITVDN